MDLRQPYRAAVRLPARWTPFIVLLVIVVLQAVLFVSVIEVGLALDPDGFVEQTPPGYLALYSVIKNAVVFLVLFIAVRVGRADDSPTLRLKRVSICGLTVACLMILSLVPWDIYLAGHLGGGRMMVEADTTQFNPALAVSCMSSVLLAPVAEELFFRGFTLSVLGKRSVVAGIFGSCVLFGIYHFTGSVASFVIPLPFALGTAYSVVVTGSVFPAIVAHALWNLLAVVREVGYVVLEPTRGMLFGSMLVCAACAGLLLPMNRRPQSPSRR